MDRHKLAKLGDTLDRLVKEEQIPFAHVLVARKGVVYYEHTTSNTHKSNQLVPRDAIYRIYSMTKPITSVGLMMLFEDGKFLLNEPISKFLPYFAKKNMKVFSPDGNHKPSKHSITFAHVLTHTTGLSYGFDPTGKLNPLDKIYHDSNVRSSGEQADQPDIPLSVFIPMLAKMPLQHEPGEHWHYSLATDVAGHLIEVISGQSLPEFLKQRIFDPLGMQDTFFDIPDGKLSRLLPNFMPATAQMVMSPTKKPDPTVKGLKDCSKYTTKRYLPHPKPKYYAGGGGLVSTVHDYFLFCEALRGRGRATLLSPETLRLMTTNFLPNNGDMRGMLVPLYGDQYSEITERGVGFGLGFSVLLDPVPGGTLANKGTFAWGGAASTAFWIDPVLDLVVVFMTQLQYADRAALPLRPILNQLVYAAVKGESKL